MSCYRYIGDDVDEAASCPERPSELPIQITTMPDLRPPPPPPEETEGEVNHGYQGAEVPSGGIEETLRTVAGLLERASAGAKAALEILGTIRPLAPELSAYSVREGWRRVWGACCRLSYYAAQAQKTTSKAAEKVNLW